MKQVLAALCVLVLLSSCGVSKAYQPGKKYGPDQLQKDYRIFREILEESHPSLYWYTPKDSIDYYFQWGASHLTDSMQEYQFRNILTYVTSKLRCGHTTVRASRQAVSFADRVRSYAFPLGVKSWGDTTMVTTNLNRKDSAITRGVILKSIDGRPIDTILDSMFQHLSADGYNLTHKYQTVSNAGAFRSLYVYFFGLRQRMAVEYIDTLGQLKRVSLMAYNPAADTPHLRRPPVQRPSRRERKRRELEQQRSFRVDTALNTGFMEINAFSKSNKLHPFLRRSFRRIHKDQITNLVVDMRGNGGGNVTLSNLLTKYLADKPFKIADSLYAVTNKSSYKKYFSQYFWNRLFFMFLTRKKSDGNYHFAMYEGRYFKPKRRHHFEGTTYILTGGNTFSAATLFAQALRPQEDVVIVGEETGGGSYGNTAWLIPTVTLPTTKIRLNLPLFRLVIDKESPKGRGVMPEVEVPPTVRAIRNNEDYKMDRVIELIRQGKDSCGQGVMRWAGDPAADGLGWILSDSTGNGSIVLLDLPEAFKKDGLPVQFCIARTQTRVPCFCVEPKYAYAIRSLKAL